jgi:hypothetical protein
MEHNAKKSKLLEIPKREMPTVINDIKETSGRKPNNILTWFKRFSYLYVAIGVFLLMASLFLAVKVFAHDRDGRYAGSELKPWFDHLASGKGMCCSEADGFTVADADWTTANGHYRVRIPKYEGSSETSWVDVDDDAVITEPNKFGRTMVWPTYNMNVKGSPGIWIRCFLRGSMT